MDSVADLRVLLASQFPLLMVETQEEPRLLGIIRQLAGELASPLWVWSSTRGLTRDGAEAMYGTVDPHQALSFVEDIRSPSVFVFADAHTILRDDMVVRRLKEVCQEAVPGQTLILTGPNHEVPAELESLAHVWQLRPPGRAEMADLVDRALATFRRAGIRVDLIPEDVTGLVEAVAGLTLSEADRLLHRAASDDGVVDSSDLTKVRVAKAAMFTTDGTLELVEATRGGFDDVGGMASLKQWLEIRGRARAAGTASLGIDDPRGVLLTGVPGCGKSLIAKKVAAAWGLPLVLLDPSRLYGKYIGESEQRLARALDSVDAMAPVVLWIDEIEKGLATSGDGDGGVSRRLLGTFLRWMQDRPDGVFLVATANDVSSLPPELLRKGRFDEIFFVDLPNDDARTAILGVHLTERGRNPEAFDLVALTRLSDGFSGAEIEAAVVGALYRAFAKDRDMATRDIAIEMQSTVPLSVARAEEISALRRWASARSVPA
ncbi:MAG: AAA family ATPase [Acidimicrobiia bacterium]|nr:AAA family ATPase [Acidimicrobiia bacterium]